MGCIAAMLYNRLRRRYALRGSVPVFNAARRVVHLSKKTGSGNYLFVT